jgi:anti-sigma factor RsiW
MRHLGERLSALIDGELSAARRERVLVHLARCEPCRREATALRLLKQRMHTLGDATVGDTLTWRLLAMAAAGGQGPGARWPRRAGRPGWARPARRRRPARSLLVAGLATAVLGLPAAVFAAGSDHRPPPGPRVVPALDVFMVQHAITSGDVPVQPSSRVRSPAGAASSIP